MIRAALQGSYARKSTERDQLRMRIDCSTPISLSNCVVKGYTNMERDVAFHNQRERNARDQLRVWRRRLLAIRSFNCSTRFS